MNLKQDFIWILIKVPDVRLKGGRWRLMRQVTISFPDFLYVLVVLFIYLRVCAEVKVFTTERGSRGMDDYIRREGWHLDVGTTRKVYTNVFGGVEVSCGLRGKVDITPPTTNVPQTTMWPRSLVLVSCPFLQTPIKVGTRSRVILRITYVTMV